jgi:TonB family protein
VLESSGNELLDRAATAAARTWRFRGGPGSLEIPFEFVLR